MITEPVFNLPLFSASSIIALAILSFIEPDGLKYSSFASIFAFRFNLFSICVSSRIGVLPISWSADVYIAMIKAPFSVYCIKAFFQVFDYVVNVFCAY